jgi:hypothetical protein
MTKRKRLSHQQFHQCCVWLAGKTDPGTSEINATINALIALVAQDLEIMLNREQVRGMLEATGLTCRPDSDAGSLRQQVAAHEVAIQELTKLVNELLQETTKP